MSLIKHHKYNYIVIRKTDKANDWILYYLHLSPFIVGYPFNYRLRLDSYLNKKKDLEMDRIRNFMNIHFHH